MGELGKWAVIDLETSGVDPLQDQIIDVGFLQFDGRRLVRRFESLVGFEGELSRFIQKLTGITSNMAAQAPHWRRVEPEVMELRGHHLIAHNAKFEQSFLQEHFDKIAEADNPEEYQDSLPYLALLFPNSERLGLEHFILNFGLADKEQHRGLSDSLDLLKVLLVATALVKRDQELEHFLKTTLTRYNLADWWFARFLHQEPQELFELAGEIEFDLDAAEQKACESFQQNTSAGEEPQEQGFSPGFNSEDIQAMYRDEKGVRRLFPGYRYRPSQEELSVRIGQAFNNDVHAIIQAPTGTGKTLGYLLPAALFAKDKGEQVLVATATKTLQKQAVEQDIPKLRKLLRLGKDKLKVQRLVGSSNHLCALLFREREPNLGEELASVIFEAIFFHNARSDLDDQILRLDLSYALKKNLPGLATQERQVAVDFRSCTGPLCPLRHGCSYLRTLREAREADILIGNHALMFNWPKGLPRPAHVIVDEAHKIERESTRAFTLESVQADLENLPKSLRHLQGLTGLFYLLAQRESSPGDSTGMINQIKEKALATAERLEEQLLPLPETIAQWFQRRPRYTEEYWNEATLPGKDSGEQLGINIYRHFEHILALAEDMLAVLRPHLLHWEGESLGTDEEIGAASRFRAFTGTLEDLICALATSLEGASDHAHCLRYHQKRGYEVTSVPIDTGRVVHDQLLAPSSSVAFTSATLGNADGECGTRAVEWACGHSYLPPQKRFAQGLFLPAVFNYRDNTRIFLCDEAPPLYHNSFVPETLACVIPLISSLGGRTLLLYSARKRFEIAREILLEHFEGKIPLFIQGMGGRVVQDFKDAPAGVLLGMESFGEGIDIPGERLQFLFVDKIPDLPIEQVINSRREFFQANLGNEFGDYYLAHRARSLQQKLGRLIRSESDIGAAIVVDCRIKKWKAASVRQFLQLMSPYHLERRSLKDASEGVRHFLQG